jgi:hypothetical protein
VQSGRIDLVWSAEHSGMAAARIWTEAPFAPPQTVQDAG